MFLFWSVCGVVQILEKWEFLNPGGSVKDGVAVKIIEKDHEVNICYLYFFDWCCCIDLRVKERNFNVGVLFIFVWIFNKLEVLVNRD